MLNRQDLLWAKATKVSRQANAQRFLEFPASVFERVLQEKAASTEAQMAATHLPSTSRRSRLRSVS